MSLENYPSFLLNFSECEMDGEGKHFYQFKSFRLDVEERQLLNNGKAIALTPKAFDVLVALVERNGHLVEKDELLRIVWADSFVEEANVARIVHTLRKILGEDKNGNKFIETVAKKGYRFVAVCDEQNKPADFPDSPNEMTVLTAPSEENSTIEKGSVDENNQKKQLSINEKSSERFWLRGIFAFILIGGILIGGLFLFNFSGAKSDNTLSFERMNQTSLTQSGDVYGPTISPNGQYLVYIKIEGRNHSLQLRQTATERILELLPPRPDVSFWALVFSPDSNYLYYVEAGENQLGILYRIPSFGGQPQKIVEFVSGNITVAPNGMKLAFKRINKKEGVTSIITINNDGSDARTIAAIDTDSEYWSLDWSPDGSTILYVVKDYKPDNTSWYVAEIPADGGAERRIGEPRETKILAAIWLPDKTGIILNAADAKTKLPQIYYLSYPDGAVQRRITNDLNDYKGVTITADGKSIVSQKTEQNRQIWLVPDGDASRARQLTFKKDQHFEMASWLTNDTLVFDVDENGNYDNNNIWRMNIGDNEEQPLTTGADDNTFPVASPDGKTIVFVSSHSGKPEIWRMNLDGTQPTQLTDLGYEFLTLQFSPDGQTIYFKCYIGGKGRLMRVSVNGGEAVSISDADIYRWAISPDGKKLAYSSHNSDTQKGMTRIRPIDEDRTEKVFDIQPETYLQWSKDGQALYFTLAADDGKNIWRQSLSETKPRRITDLDDQQVFRFSSSPDGKNLAVIRYSTTFDAVLLKFGE